MKLGTCMFLGAAGLMSLGLAATLSVEGCGSTASSATNNDGGPGATGATGPGSDGGGPGTDGGSGGTGTVPPPAPTGPTTTATTAQNYALHHIHLGDELDSTGAPDWYKYGYNLDNKNTTSKSTDVCTLAANANKKNQVDGPGGIDNSFGENIIPLLSAVASNPSATINNSIALGHFTVMMDVTGLDGTATQTASGLAGRIFGGQHFDQGPNATGSVPKFTKADVWPLDKSYVTSGIGTDANQTLVQPVTSNINFTGAYVVNGQFVSGGPTAVTLTLTISGVALVVPVQHAVITFKPGTSGTNVTSGIIAGVIDAQTLITNLQGVAGNIATAFCSGSAFDQVKTSILQASDILDDGTNPAPVGGQGTPCTGISVGIGFDADEISQPLVGGNPTVGVNPCVDGGAADSGATDASGD